ncbi:hypothetical protein [Bosea lathyri]|uniref:hypothetical protein n=1 Tax=Bosea lathyri TaxID=1036778 RepID=UPI0011B0595D|nr:hypothetical protein [Bosea lathyri]
MSIFHFRLNAVDRIWIEEEAYRSVGRLEASHLLLGENTRAVRICSDDELDGLILAGQVRIDHRTIRSRASSPRVSPVADVHIAPMPRQERERIIRREIYCRRFLEMERAGDAKRSDAAMHRAIAIIHVEMKEAEWLPGTKADRSAGHIVAVRPPPSVRTMRRALEQLEQSGFSRTATAARRIRGAK